MHKSGKDNNYNFQILDAVINVNDKQKTALIPKVVNHFGENLTGKTISIWGLAFKPETDDIREAPSLYIIDELLARGAKLKVFDPEAMDNVKAKLGDKIEYATSMYGAISNTDALIICTEWSIFRTPNFQKLREHLNQPIIFDGRNLYDVADMEKEGFTYFSIGRKEVL